MMQIWQIFAFARSYYTGGDENRVRLLEAAGSRVTERLDLPRIVPEFHTEKSIVPDSGLTTTKQFLV